MTYRPNSFANMLDNLFRRRHNCKYRGYLKQCFILPVQQVREVPFAKNRPGPNNRPGLWQIFCVGKRFLPYLVSNATKPGNSFPGLNNKTPRFAEGFVCVRAYFTSAASPGSSFLQKIDRAQTIGPVCGKYFVLAKGSCLIWSLTRPNPAIPFLPQIPCWHRRPWKRGRILSG